MLRFVNKEYREDAHKWLVEVYCASTDTKPGEGYMNGSVLIEVDTGYVYLYNEDTDSWVKV